jgi:ABC-type branched-subunit amino acid transport system ATPase component
VLDLGAGRHPELRQPDDAPRPAVVALARHRDEPAVTTAAAPAPALRVRGVSVSFGGNHAVRDVSLDVDHGQIVGLIGSNGAGKTTLLNAIGGFVRSSGSIELDGVDISAATASERARAGLGRTFQAARLFPELSVRETVQVALEARWRTSFATTAMALPHARRIERRQRAAASELINFLGLGGYSDEYVADLSTGTRRIVELANLLALEATVLCLDEPTAGLAQRETEAFGPLLVEVRRQLSCSMIIVEHDMPLIMSVSDHMYCLEAGVVIASGGPAAMRTDPAVIASYLGTDERAIQRSGALT